MKKFVVGIVFDLNLQNILLIKKNRPSRMAGLFNGIGGKVEEDETFDEAMEREATEEAGLSGLLWKRGPKISVDDLYVVRFYYAVMPGPIVYQQKTDEELYVNALYTMDSIYGWGRATVQPLPWVIDCCLYDLRSKEAQNALASGNEDV